MSNKKNKDKNKFLSIFAVVVSLILVATLLDSIGAQNISRDINLGIRSDITDQYPFYVNHRKSYTSGNERWLHGHIGGSMRPEISNHTIAVNYYARIQNSATGQNISN